MENHGKSPFYHILPCSIEISCPHFNRNIGFHSSANTHHGLGRLEARPEDDDDPREAGT